MRLQHGCLFHPGDRAKMRLMTKEGHSQETATHSESLVSIQRLLLFKHSFSQLRPQAELKWRWRHGCGGCPGGGLSGPSQSVRAIRALAASSFLFPLSMLAVIGSPTQVTLPHDGPKEQWVLDGLRLRLQTEVENILILQVCLQKCSTHYTCRLQGKMPWLWFLGVEERHRFDKKSAVHPVSNMAATLINKIGENKLCVDDVAAVLH